MFEISPLVDGKGLRLEGELDLAASPRLADALLDFATSEREVHLDLSEVSFMDSSGLHVILALARSRGDDWVVRRPPRSLSAVMRVFEILGIDEHPGVEIRRPGAEPITV